LWHRIRILGVVVLQGGYISQHMRPHPYETVRSHSAAKPGRARSAPSNSECSTAAVACMVPYGTDHAAPCLAVRHAATNVVLLCCCAVAGPGHYSAVLQRAPTSVKMCTPVYAATFDTAVCECESSTGCRQQPQCARQTTMTPTDASRAHPLALKTGGSASLYP
jgi:hypothetical protein